MKKFFIFIFLLFVVLTGQSWPPYILNILSGSNIVVTGSNTPTVSVTNAPKFTGYVEAGSGSITSCVSGDLCTARSTTGGAIELGGSGKSCIIDYNITTTNFLTIPCAKYAITASSGNVNVQANNTGPGLTTFQLSATSGAVQQVLQVTTSTTPTPGPITFGTINFNDLAYGGTQAMGALQGGIADHGDGTHGGFFLINTTSFGATPIALEALQMTPGGHIGMPQDIVQAVVTSPSTCAGLTVCSTYTWTFTYPYLTNAGNAQTPICLSPSIEDETDSTIIWQGNVKYGSESSTSVIFNYAPEVATGTAHTLLFTMTCHQASF